MRRAWILASLAVCLAPVTVLAQTSATAPQRWYRGNTHTHSNNSDGDSPAADVVRWYRTHGYDFLVITDHEFVTDVAPLNALYGAPGRFLVLAGQEVTQRLVDSTRAIGRREAHVNAIGSNRVVWPLGEQGMAQGMTLTETYARNLTAIRAAGGLPQINHPNFRWSVGPEDLLDVPDSTLFELWNGQPGVNNLGGRDATGTVLSTEALWDTVLTRGKLLFGVGSDDSHDFRPERLEDPRAARPGLAWVMVQADTLTAAALLASLRAGRFYASTGVALDEYRVDKSGISLSLRHYEPGDDTRHRVEFVGGGGRVLADAYGPRATYRFRGDEGYVRVRVTDSNGARAWTQPVLVDP